MYVIQQISIKYIKVPYAFQVSQPSSPQTEASEVAVAETEAKRRKAESRDRNHGGFIGKSR